MIESNFLTNLVPIFRNKLANGRDDYYLIQAPYNQNVPQDQFATIQLLNIAQKGTLEQFYIGSEGQAVKKHYDVTVRVQTFGEGALTDLNRLATSLEFESMTEALGNVSVGLRDYGQVTNLTQLIQTSFEQRASLDIDLGTSVAVFDEDVIPVESVSVDIDVNNNK